MEGVPLQTMDNGSVGGHWNEAVLGDELMTPQAESAGARVGDFSLALLEDTNWYKADYSRTENFTFLKNGGCDFVKGQSCPVDKPCEQGQKNFITRDYKGLGFCSKDKSGCNVERMYSNRNCDVETGWASNLKETFGAYYGQNCLMVEANLKAKMPAGWITTYESAKLPVYAWCSADSKKYTLAFKNFGRDWEGNLSGYDAWVECTEEGEVEFNKHWAEGKSTVKCQNPQKLCEARFESSGKNGALCDKSCEGNGRCQNTSYGSGPMSGDTGNGDDSGDGDDSGNGDDSGDGDGSGDGGDGSGDGGDDSGNGGDDSGDDDGSGETKYDKDLKKLLWLIDTYGYECKPKSNEFLEMIKYGYNRLAERKTLRQISHKKNLNTDSSKWMCWCYSSFTRTSGACGSV